MVKQWNNNARITRITILLYIRMFLTMGIGLYASRILLVALGVVDYGIYNIIGGVSSMFVFINGSMGVATSRFITFAIGRNDPDYESRLFKHIVWIHYAIGIIILFLIETIGLWFLYYRIAIPAERMDVAFWVFQCTAVLCFLNVIITPYNALIIGHERISVFAYISILQSLLNLGIAILVMASSSDKLLGYAILFVLKDLLIRVIYIVYCKRMFTYLHVKKVPFDWNTVKKITDFAGWNIMGNAALMTTNQGISILLNMFFGPIVNASQGVVVQISNLLMSFANNIRMALNPQITKSYSVGDGEYMRTLIRYSSVYTFYLLFISFVPIWLAGDKLLAFWLVEVPSYSFVFMKLSMIYLLVNSFSNPIIIGVHATGNIRRFQIMESILMLCTLPIAYIMLKSGLDAIFAYVAMIVGAIISQIGRLYVALPLLGFQWRHYIREILFPPFRVASIGAIIMTAGIFYNNSHPVTVAILCTCLTTTGIFLVGINKKEKQTILKLARAKLA